MSRTGSWRGFRSRPARRMRMAAARWRVGACIAERTCRDPLMRAARIAGRALRVCDPGGVGCLSIAVSRRSRTLM